MPNQNRRLFLETLFVIIALFGLLTTQAVAASFDCNKATTWVEKSVCSNPELSKLDEELAKAYHDALASLSPEGQKETKEYQRQWLKKLPGCQSVECLEDFYKKRIKQLQESLIKFPDRTFRNVHFYYFKVEKTCSFGFTDGDLAYPQIENPRNENEKLWNNFIFKQATDHFLPKLLTPGQDCVECNDNYTVSFSNKNLISVKRLNSIYTQGAIVPAHGYAESFSWLLDSKRELEASDLFDVNTDWRNELTSLVTQKLEEKEANDRETLEKTLSMLVVGRPRNWVISKDGLGFGFREKYLEGFRVFITIDWKTLDPYLSKNGHSLIYD